MNRHFYSEDFDWVNIYHPFSELYSYENALKSILPNAYKDKVYFSAFTCKQGHIKAHMKAICQRHCRLMW